MCNVRVRFRFTRFLYDILKYVGSFGWVNVKLLLMTLMVNQMDEITWNASADRLGTYHS